MDKVEEDKEEESNPATPSGKYQVASGYCSNYLSKESVAATCSGGEACRDACDAKCDTISGCAGFGYQNDDTHQCLFYSESQLCTGSYNPAAHGSNTYPWEIYAHPDDVGIS